MYPDAPSQSHHHPQLACPHCGHNSIVQHGNVYTCLNCNFQRNVSEPTPLNGLMTAIGIVGVLWGLLQLMQPVPDYGNPPPSLPEPLYQRHSPGANLSSG
ncbi:MAG: hypothetical protein KME20_14990 [Kaiparowitsia implicata GSE-PSE-MK54-09C]|jgi:hypothetical protein|nr:hypothetical protein [Kaiparowitsia implicata GSE-PSE-MK54-09C]